MGINNKIFEKTDKSVIAVELIRYNGIFGPRINDDSLEQLLAVVHYAFDKGSTKVIAVNNTGFSPDELWRKIKDQLPEKEKERTLARFAAMGFAPSISMTTQNGLNFAAPSMTGGSSSSLSHNKAATKNHQ
ncbi:MAG: hypothetical protein ACHQAX_05915 [Gammaproteobacteria bacterium]